VNRGLVALETATFLKGHEKAFLLFMAPCQLCRECEGTTDGCKHPRAARPVPEALAVDVFSTARQAGYPIEVLTEYTQAMNRYALLLIE
jgi:predicted metal-binding protein